MDRQVFNNPTKTDGERLLKMEGMCVDVLFLVISISVYHAKLLICVSLIKHGIVIKSRIQITSLIEIAHQIQVKIWIQIIFVITFSLSIFVPSPISLPSLSLSLSLSLSSLSLSIYKIAGPALHQQICYDHTRKRDNGSKAG